MKYRCIEILLGLLVWTSSQIGAQNTLFKPFTSLWLIETEHFDIIFPEESESSARTLASYADKTYKQVSALLGIDVPGRIPVTFVPHTDSFNGYYNPVPYPHILLYDTPMDLEWTNFANNLEGLFLHELTHAVSLNTRRPFLRGLQRIFGNWVTPSAINSPAFMTEGVTVSFESLSGFGRANDPRIKQYLRQAIYEDKFLTPFQVSGVYDIPNQANMNYEYGGLFSKWLQDNYGMEKYAELWQAMGRSFYFSVFTYRSGYYHLFKNVYGVDFIDEWNAFKSSLTLYGLETNNEEFLPEEYRFFSKKDISIQALTAWKETLYFISGGEVRAYNTVTGKQDSFNPGSCYDIDVSADGKTLLLSGYRLASGSLSGSGRYSAIVTEHRADSGRRTGRTINGLYKARYFRDGVIGIRSDLHNTCIVYEDFNGRSEMLFQGNESLLFSGPQAVDEERIVFIAADNGIRELWLYNYISGELFRIESASGDDEYWLFMRGLGVYDGKLLFSHNADDRMYKLGLIDLDTMQGVFNSRDFSGGVFDPVSIDDSIYYIGAFFSGDSLLRFPEKSDLLSGKRSDITLVKLEKRNYEKTSEAEYSEPVKEYYALNYMNPFKLWLPLPLLRIYSDNTVALDVNLDGVGIFSMMTDPANRNSITTLIYADIPYRMARIEQFSWQNTGMGFPLAFNFSDVVEGSVSNPMRLTNASLNGTFTRRSGQWSYRFSLGLGYNRIAAYEEDKNAYQNAYQWKETKSSFSASNGFSLWNRRMVLRLSAASSLSNFLPRVDGVFQTNTDTRFPVHFTLFGAYDNGGMNLHGISNNYGGSLISSYTLAEYSQPIGLNLLWTLGGEAALDLFSFEIQKNLSHVYFNRFFGTLALRNQLYDGMGIPNTEGIGIYDLRLVQSLRLKLGMKATVFPVVKFPLSIEPYILGSWKLSNTITGDKSPWYLHIGINTSF